MTEIERKAVRLLLPYFSKVSRVYDVGSNKGEWSDCVINNVDALHLFEPNERLLTYTMVKFDRYKNVHYHPIGIFSESKEMPFYFFNNENNGLSSVFYNSFWVDEGLPMKKGKIKCKTLDSLSSDIYIDFVKIDVEGADFDVLLGSEKLLSKKNIKFIQIEHSDHYKLSGHSFSEVIPFIQKFGYDMFTFDGEKFIKGFISGQENYYIMDKDFTQDWNREFIKNTKGMKFNFVLEIGCFEGLTTSYVCDNLLNPDGRVICIDPLTDEYLPDHPDNNLFIGQYNRFIKNTKGLPVELIRMKSNEAFFQKGFSDYRFDLIYIDGDHREDEVYADGAKSIDICRVDGYILFDDYQWRDGTKRGIDRFLRDFAPWIDVVVLDYQVMVRKKMNRS